jgi:hypothetical protein
MCGLNETPLQDAAAMLILHPERSSHPLFRLACFGTTAFEVRVHIICFVCSILLYPYSVLLLIFYFKDFKKESEADIIEVYNPLNATIEPTGD